jgi:hypothetical protein
MIVPKVVSMSIVGSLIAATALTTPTTPGPTRTTATANVVSHHVNGTRAEAESSEPGDGAIVVRGFLCEIPVSGHGEVRTTSSHTVITPSGNAATSCHAHTDIVVPKAVVVKDIPCATIGPAGTDSHLVVTPSGHLNFWCHHHR